MVVFHGGTGSLVKAAGRVVKYTWGAFQLNPVKVLQQSVSWSGRMDNTNVTGIAGIS